MKTIKLTKGQFAIVDNEDYKYLSQWKWCALKTSVGFYGYRTKRISKTKKHNNFLMHRVIMKTPNGMITDHKNHNTLDNRKENLRICSQSQNLANKRKSLNKNSSKFKGVDLMIKTYKNNIYRYYRASITHNGHWFHIGLFKTEHQAAMAYDLWAKDLNGEFAELNFERAI